MSYPIDRVKKIIAALRAAGAKEQTIPYLLAQCAHETGAFKSNVFNTDTNASGIMFINKPTKQKNATRGSKYPANEGKYNYARFATLKDWAVDYLRILGNTAASSKNLTDFAAKLKARKYYTDSVNNYANGLKAHTKQLIKAGVFPSDPVPNNQTAAVSDTKKIIPLLIGALIVGAYLYSSN